MCTSTLLRYWYIAILPNHFAVKTNCLLPLPFNVTMFTILKCWSFSTSTMAAYSRAILNITPPLIPVKCISQLPNTNGKVVQNRQKTSIFMFNKVLLIVQAKQQNPRRERRPSAKDGGWKYPMYNGFWGNILLDQKQKSKGNRKKRIKPKWFTLTRQFVQRKRKQAGLKGKVWMLGVNAR